MLMIAFAKYADAREYRGVWFACQCQRWGGGDRGRTFRDGGQDVLGGAMPGPLGTAGGSPTVLHVTAYRSKAHRGLPEGVCG